VCSKCAHFFRPTEIICPPSYERCYLGQVWPLQFSLLTRYINLRGRALSPAFSSPTMPRRTHYSPCIDRVIVCALYHEGRRLRRPMTRLVNDLLTSSLQHTEGWSIAATQMSVPAQGRIQEAGTNS